MTDETFYSLIAFGMVIIMLLYVKPMFAFIILTSMFFIPMFFIWTVYNIKQYGFMVGINNAWKTFEQWWNKEPILKDPEVFRSTADDML